MKRQQPIPLGNLHHLQYNSYNGHGIKKNTENNGHNNQYNGP